MAEKKRKLAEDEFVVGNSDGVVDAVEVVETKEEVEENGVH